MMRLIDAHLDIAWNAVGLGRDPALPVDEARRREQGTGVPEREGEVTVSIGDLQAGASVVFGTLFVLPAQGETTIQGMTYASAEEAHAQAQQQLAYYRELERRGLLSVVTDRSGLARALAGETLGLVVLMEGADPIRTPDEVGAWFDAGLRIVGPAWQGTRYAGGTHAPGPLTPLGRELVRELDRHCMALDLSHLAEESFWEALELFRGPVLASHVNSRALVPTDRQLSDEMVRAVVERDGVIGVLPHNDFLVPAWDNQKESVGLDALLRHVEHICALAGDRRHIGLGSDFDGGFGRQGIPRELDRWTDLAQLGPLLAGAGWSSDEVAGFMGGNWRRWLERALPD